MASSMFISTIFFLIKVHECHFPPSIMHITDVFAFLLFPCNLNLLIKSILTLNCLFQNSSLTSSISIIQNLFLFEIHYLLKTHFFFKCSILFDWWMKQRCVWYWCSAFIHSLRDFNLWSEFL